MSAVFYVRVLVFTLNTCNCTIILYFQSYFLSISKNVAKFSGVFFCQNYLKITFWNSLKKLNKMNSNPCAWLIVFRGAELTEILMEVGAVED